MGLMKAILGELGGYGAGRNSYRRTGNAHLFIEIEDKKLKKNLQSFRRSTQTKIVKASTRIVLRAAAKDMKSRVPTRLKRVKKALHWSLRKGYKVSHVVAKVGVHVGISRAKRATWAGETKQERKNRGKKGVGMSAHNLHWFIMGTNERKLKVGSAYGPPAGHPTGRMKAHKRLWNLVNSSKIATDKGWVIRQYQWDMRQRIKKETEKIYRKNQAS